MFSLDHLRSLAIEGPDAVTYANAQFTVAADTLSADRWSPLAWCDPKGRVLSVMMARSGEGLVELVLPAAQANDIGEQLRRFTIGRRASVASPATVAGSFEPDSETPLLDVDATRGIQAGIAAQFDADAVARWQRLDLCHGLPWLEPISSGRHLPQWLGLEALGALTYDKGCYPGQEVIARLHYRGSVKYRLRGLRTESPVDWQSHARLADGEGNTTGHCLCGMSTRTQSIGLAVLGAGIAEGSDVFLEQCGRSTSAQVTLPEALC